MGQMQLLVQLGLRNVLRNPRRSVLTIFAIAAGLWSALGISSVARGLSTQMALNSIDNLTGHAQVHAIGYRADPSIDKLLHPPPQNFPATLAEARISSWATRVRVPAVALSEREALGVTFFGIDPESERNLSFIGRGVKEGVVLSGVGDEGIIIGKKLAELLRTRLGKRLVIMSEGADGKIRNRGFIIVGIYEAELASAERSFVFTGRATAQKMLDIGNRISEISVKTEESDNLDPVLSQLRTQFPNDEVHPWTVLEPLSVAVRKIQDGFLFLWSIIVLVTIAFGLVNTLFMAIFERTKEFGLFQALGMRQSTILMQIIVESTILLTVGGLIGNGLSLLTVFALRDGIDLSHFAAGTSQFQVSRILVPTIFLRDWLIANSIILLISLASAFYPARRASQLSVLEALGR